MSVTAAAARSVAKGKADDFTGDVLLESLTAAEGKSLLAATYVTFAPGARSVWHSHVNRQVLVVTEETGNGPGAKEMRGEDEERMHRGHDLWLATLKWRAEEAKEW